MVCWDFFTPNIEGRLFMTSQEFDAYLDMQPLEVPPYHEQLLVMEEMEEAKKWKPAVEALEGLRERLMFFENAYAKEDQELMYVRAALGAYRIAIETLDLELDRYRRYAGLSISQKGGVL
jgi:hypothetical protein